MKSPNKAQFEFIERNRNLPAEELVVHTGLPIRAVRKVLAELPPVTKFQVHSSGAVCMTQAQSEEDDHAYRGTPREAYLQSNKNAVHIMRPGQPVR